MATLSKGLATVAELSVSGGFSGLLQRRRTKKMIDSYSHHLIIGTRGSQPEPQS